MAEGAFAIKIEGMDDLKKAFEKSPKIVKDAIDPAIKKAIFSIQAKAIPHIPTDRGFLRGPGNVTIFSTLKGVLKNRAPYAIFVHEGTKPHFPPLHAIEKWADRHGIPPFLVARAIAKKGTKGKPFYDLAVKETKPLLDQIFSGALKDITLKLAK